MLPRTVILLGIISLLNDIAGEMLAPYMPVFLTVALGAGPAVVGFIEGLALATAAMLKLLAGRLTDRGWRIKPMILSGYGLSNTVRPLIGLATSWPMVVVLRFADRIGKGLRSTPRDALLAASVPQAIRGRAFGFHRAMDHTGAMLGPLIGSLLLAYGLGVRDLFFISAIPGLALMLLISFGLKARDEKVAHEVAAASAAEAADDSTTHAEGSTLDLVAWRALARDARGLLLASALLALATLPDALLVLWAMANGISVVQVGLIWAAGHAARALIAGLSGELSDRWGRLPLVVSGWLARIGLLSLLALWQSGGWSVWLLFLGYFCATAWSEPAEIALLGDRAPAHQRGTVIGLYHMLSGLMALPGGIALGLLWQLHGASTAFATAAALTTLATLMLGWFLRP